MKIEKVNENQIRCTLTREDLVSRELKISELAYMSGFKTQASFNSAFRRYTGEAPSDWARRNFKKIVATASPDAEAVLQN